MTGRKYDSTITGISISHRLVLPAGGLGRAGAGWGGMEHSHSRVCLFFFAPLRQRVSLRSARSCSLASLSQRSHCRTLQRRYFVIFVISCSSPDRRWAQGAVRETVDEVNYSRSSIPWAGRTREIHTDPTSFANDWAGKQGATGEYTPCGWLVKQQSHPIASRDMCYQVCTPKTWNTARPRL